MTLTATYAPDASIEAPSSQEVRLLAVGAGEEASLGSVLSRAEGSRVLVRCAKGRLCVGDDGRVVSPGQAFVWEAGVLVRVLEAPVKAVVFVVPRGLLAAAPVGRPLDREGEAARAVDDLMVAWGSGDADAVGGRVRELLRAFSGAEPVRSARTAAAYAAREHMGERLSRPSTIPMLAEACGVSPTVLKEAFRAEFGLPIYEWCRRLRMLAAADLLAGGTDSVGAIARAVGYSNASKFARAFCEVEGVSPSAYRA